MKRCPQCEAEYDDHVEYCFVDGAELVQQGVGPGRSRSALTPLPPPAPPASPSRRMMPLAIGLGALAVVLMVVAAGISVALVMGGADELPPTVDREPPMAAGTRPSIVVESALPSGPVAAVQIESVPPGAEVWEGNTLLCERTPCRVDHPEHAPIPREFEVRLSGYQPKTVTMTDASQVWEVTLQAPRRAARSGRASSPKPAPAPNDAPDILLDR